MFWNSMIIIAAVAVFGSLALLVYAGPNKVADSVEGFLKFIGSTQKQTLSDYIDIENVDLENTHTFVHRDGTLMTILRHGGSFNMVGQEEFDSADAAINRQLAAYMQNNGHAVQTVFTIDPDLTERVIREAQAPHRATAERLQLGLDDVFDEEVEHLSSQCSVESCFVALYTRPSVLAKDERKAEAEHLKGLFKGGEMPLMSDAASLFRVARLLRIRHESFVEAFVRDLKNQKMSCELLDTHEASREIRYAIDPEWTDDSWRPCLVGDPIPQRDIKRDPADVTGGLWPPLWSQLAPRDAIRVNTRHVQIGGRVYAPSYIDLAPQDIQVFQRLFRRTRDTKLPWRMSLLIESGQGLWDFKGLAAMLFHYSNKANNSEVTKALDAIRHAAVEDKRTKVRLRIDLATWAPAGDQKLLEQRSSQLARAIEGWGTAEVSEVSGDPTQAFVAGGIGASLKSVATPALALLDDVTHFLPWYRPASPWATGAVLFKADGKLWPFQPHSSVQSSHINIIYAEPRSGKSVLGNAINYALCLSPGITRLPLISIIDVGRSSSGLISLLEHALPASKRHLVASIRMRPSKEYSINPCDTQLGCRFPLPLDFAALLNLVLTLVTPHGEEKADPAMSEIARMAIEHAYKSKSDSETPKLYTRHTIGAEEVDEAVDQYGLHVDEDTTWWEIVDHLFAKGAIHAATLANRFAVPQISDIGVASGHQHFKDLFGEKLTKDGTENVLAAFNRMISSSVRAYPVLSGPTKFDIGETRVVSIDLDEVAKSGSAAADHQTAVFYLLARMATTRNFYLHEDDIEFVNPRYRDFHLARFKTYMEDKKHIQYDEFHRTKKIQSVREQAIGDMREGGKRGVMISLISQDVNDFDQQMLTFASCKIILSRADEATVTRMKDVFGLSKTVEYNVRKEIRPPGRSGSTFVGMWRVRDGDYAQTLTNTMGGIKLWAFSTSNEDTILRDALYRGLGPEEARRVLARLYPGGTVREELERRQRGMDEVDDESVVQSLVSEIIADYQRAKLAPVAAPAERKKVGYPA